MSLNTLIEKYTPVYYLHESEKYYPCTPDYYLAHASLVVDNVTVMKAPTQKQLYEYHFKDDMFLQLDKNPTQVRKGFCSLNAPVYAFTKTTDEFLYVTYIVFLLIMDLTGSLV